MNPHIINSKEVDGTLSFTLNGVNLSLANAIRRTILSDIPTVVFKTTPYEENKATIHTNTTRLNNEIIKQRLSCIPIYISDLQMPLKNYILEVNVENITDTIIYVTTEDFKIKNIVTNQYLSDKDTKDIFPPNDYTGNYIDFVRLRPKITDEIPGERIHLSCEFTIGTAKEDGSFNVVSSCSYGFTPDHEKIDDELRRKIQQWKDEGFTEDAIKFESNNWKLLDALRIYKQDSFDFIIQTIGVFTNYELFNKACEIIMNKLVELDTIIETGELKIERSLNTMENSYDVILENEDYTIGKVIEYFIYNKFFENMKILSFCGYKKMHPHDNDSIIRVAYKESTDKSVLIQNIKECCADAINIFKKINNEFLKIVKN
jgi:DNA-directed RNA polymerase subunit L/DNA-directed RNA polymerase alpha subunit